MKANELMIGDIVYHEKWGNSVVEALDYKYDEPEIKIASENITHKECYNVGYRWVEEDELFPNPLTPEILEKNGFKYGDINRSIELWYLCIEPHNNFKENTLIDLYKVNNIDYFHLVSQCETTVVYANIKYIHEFQHILHIYRVEKEIIL